MRKAEEMFALVEEWENSGQTQKVFCQEQGIKLGRFAYWLRKKRQNGESIGGFLPIRVSPPSQMAEPIELVYPNGVRMRVWQTEPGVISGLVRLWGC